MKQPITVAALLVAALAAIYAPAAQAHVTLQPEALPAGGFERLDVRVPNEEDDANTTEVEVEFPSGFIFASTEPVPGWEAKIERRKLDTPVEEFGEQFTDEVGTVEYRATGEGIAPGQFQDFGLSVGLPDEPGPLTFKAIQTYDNGEVVRWIGPEDADEPAPIVTLGAAEPEEASTGPAEASTDVAADSGKDSLSLIALIVGAVALLVGGAALLGGRRSA